MIRGWITKVFRATKLEKREKFELSVAAQTQDDLLKERVL